MTHHDRHTDADATETPRQLAKRIYDAGVGCNCDLDRWQPEASTGHSCVCRIHKAALALASRREPSDA